MILEPRGNPRGFLNILRTKSEICTKTAYFLEKVRQKC